MFCNWVRKGDMALIAEDGGYLKFEVKPKKAKAPSKEEAEA